MSHPWHRSAGGRTARLLVLVLVGVTAAVVLGAGLGRESASPRSALVGRPAPALAGDLLDGTAFDAQAVEGRVVLVTLWASWCDPCREEMPVLEAAHAALWPRGLRVVGINTQDRDDAALQFLRHAGGAGFPSIRDRDGRLAAQWGAFGIPETFLVDRAGTVRTRHTGPITKTWIRRVVIPELRR